MAVRQELRDKKAYILLEHMGGELDNLHRLFQTSALIDQNEIDALPADSLKQAIGAFLVRCPVYRYYGNQMPLEPTEAAAVQTILEQVWTDQPDLTAAR